mmetsp:Transcript_46240/g.122635  ORF Transcript_46240/g.122635 Transcript_46240/m.122635 type:complete len:618 (-) Transcript_46240:120-1973(-)|eukprot:CAMPEP_0194524496 /NCGR_PEP_ID=MMETSP0253-20130528/59669_1 /TAXON_ID=2966 /ORGANISM="Noctiluca scintillans" /LENGTH=617 /DNA_ID=CAMNT_0039369123 /DNA_START=96 /DNA_END=1949 /DNA_ORIENTATION=+
MLQKHELRRISENHSFTQSAPLALVTQVAVEDPSSDVQPLWIQENQRVSLSGAWEPTALENDFSAVVFRIVGAYDPPPLQAYGENRVNIRGPSHILKDDGGESRNQWLLSLLHSSRYAPWVTGETDQNGWIYATSPDRFDTSRTGGRGGCRFWDKVRRRWWKLDHMPQIVEETATAENEPSRELSSMRQAIQAVIGHRPVLDLPLDPVAVMRRSQHDNSNYEKLVQRLQPWQDLRVLGDLCVASLYMRAAYGFTARAGYFDNAVKGALVFSMQRMVFDVAEDVDDTTNTNAFLDMLGLSSEDIVTLCWRQKGPCSAAYVVVRDHSMKWLVVAIRGTLSNKDIFTDAAAHVTPFLEGVAHEGFLKSSRRLLQELEETLKSELAELPGYRLVFCGHSMGAACAVLAAAQLRKECDWAYDCCAFGIGTPGIMSRCLGERLAEEGAMITAINQRDWSPRMTLTNVNELLDNLTELSVIRSTKRMFTGEEMPRTSELSSEEEQLPPGRILQIAMSEDGEPRLLQASPVDYRHSAQSLPDFVAHIPLLYVTALLRGFAAHLRCSKSGDKLEAFDTETNEPRPELAASLSVMVRLQEGSQLSRKGLPPEKDNAAMIVAELFPTL